MFNALFSRLVYRLPAVRRLAGDVRLLEAERDELAGHCRRLDGELAEGHLREREQTRIITELNTVREQKLRDYDALAERAAALERERNELLVRLMPADELSAKMRSEWDLRAAKNALYYTNTASTDWDVEEYFASGEANVREQIETDLVNICQGMAPAKMRVLEIGCGAGRMTRALAQMFGEVHGVDVSGEMLRLAEQHLAGLDNVSLHQTNGLDLQVVPALPFDFAMSYIVFQHIPARQVIENYIRDVGRLLKPGCLFKFQVQGHAAEGATVVDTWLGACFSLEEMKAIADQCGFELRHWHGENTQYFWLWFFKR